MKYYVRYKIRSFEGNPTMPARADFQNGPYNSYAEAAVEERDIAGYEGVYDVRVVSEMES